MHDFAHIFSQFEKKLVFLDPPQTRMCVLIPTKDIPGTLRRSFCVNGIVHVDSLQAWGQGSVCGSLRVTSDGQVATIPSGRTPCDHVLKQMTSTKYAELLPYMTTTKAYSSPDCQHNCPPIVLIVTTQAMPWLCFTWAKHRWWCVSQTWILGYLLFFLGYWDIASLKLGYWDIHVKFGILGYWSHISELGHFKQLTFGIGILGYPFSEIVILGYWPPKFGMLGYELFQTGIFGVYEPPYTPLQFYLVASQKPLMNRREPLGIARPNSDHGIYICGHFSGLCHLLWAGQVCPLGKKKKQSGLVQQVY